MFGQGTFLVAVEVLGIVILIVLLMRFLFKSSDLGKKLMKKLLWNSVIRSQIQYYFPVTLIVLGSMREESLSVVSFVKLICLLVLPTFSYFYLKMNFENLEKQEFSSKFDSLYLNLYPLKPTVFKMMSIFCIKRLIFGVSTIFLSEYVVPHMFVYVFVPLFFLGYNLVHKPMATRLLNFKENMNELLILLCAYFIPLFT